MKKVVLKVELRDDRIKRKAMKIASGFPGVESISCDVKDMKLVLVGDIDPVSAVFKLRKCCQTEIVSVGPAKEEKKEPAQVPVPITHYDSISYPLYYHMAPPLYTYS